MHSEYCKMDHHFWKIKTSSPHIGCFQRRCCHGERTHISNPQPLSHHFCVKEAAETDKGLTSACIIKITICPLSFSWLTPEEEESTWSTSITVQREKVTDSHPSKQRETCSPLRADSATDEYGRMDAAATPALSIFISHLSRATRLCFYMEIQLVVK